MNARGSALQPSADRSTGSGLRPGVVTMSTSNFAFADLNFFGSLSVRLIMPSKVGPPDGG